MDKKWGFTTRNLHLDRLREPEHGSLHQPIHTSVAFGYPQAIDLVEVFQNKAKGYAYARQSNPTNAALEAKVTDMENGLDSVLFATGMAAIGAIVFSLLKRGDHLVSTSFLFGNTMSLFHSFKRIGIDVDFVDATDINCVLSALRPETKLVFVETIANPVTQIADLEAIGKVCQKENLIYVVDGTLTTPYSFQAKAVGASLSVASLTKYIGGHGDVLGGAVTELGVYDWQSFDNIYEPYRTFAVEKQGITQIRKKGLRDLGASLHAQAAHTLSIGLETLALRYERQCENALKLADYLNSHAKVKKVHYPGLKSHPQHQRQRQLFRFSGALLSFELIDGLDCLKILDRLQVVISSTNLGDNRTLALAVAKTIFYEVGMERRKEMQIDENLIRISVGIEDIADLIGDFDQALGG